MIERLKKESRGKPLYAALYARFSSNNQRDESIDAQIRAIQEFARSNDIIIVEEYVDRAKSATTDDRPEFQRMIKESGEGKFQLVIVHKLDRFARNRNDSMAYRMKLRKNKVSLLSVLEPLDSDSPESIILESVLEGMAEFYSKNLSREVRKGLKENALKCQHTGGKPPLGYDVDKITRKLVINEDEARAVRLIFHMTLKGHGYNDILEELRGLGYKTKANKDFGKNSLYEILHNPKYKGWYVYNRVDSRDPYTKKRNSHRYNALEDMIIVRGGVPAIVSEEEFDGVQTLLEKRRYKSYHSKKNKEVYLLSGKIFCGECGCAYVGNRKNSTGNRKPNITYRCNNRGRKTTSACHNREINRDYIENFVIKKIEDSIFNKKTISAVLERYRDKMRSLKREHNEKIAHIEHMIAGCEKKEDNLTNVLAEGVDLNQRKVILGKLDDISEEKKSLQIKLGAEQNAIELEIPTREELQRYMVKARSLFREKKLNEMKQLIDLCVEKVVVYEDEVQVILNLVPAMYKKKFAQEIEVTNRDDLRKMNLDGKLKYKETDNSKSFSREKRKVK